MIPSESDRIRRLRLLPRLGVNEYRIEWSLRTCVSVAVVAALALYLPTQRTLTNYGRRSPRCFQMTA